MRPAYKRTRLWVDPPFQARLLVRMLFYLTLYTAVIWHIGFTFEAMRHVITTGPDKGISALYRDYFWQQGPLLYGFVLLVPVLLYNLLKFSHRIAGPLYRCRNVMQEMAAGKAVHEFTPRKHDLMRELFAAFNVLIRAWNSRSSGDCRLKIEDCRLKEEEGAEGREAAGASANLHSSI
jgi:hypothetical protein